MADLERIYRETLTRCAPDRLVREVASPRMPPHVVAIGKCAGTLLDGFASVVSIESAFVALPRGYPPPRTATGSSITVMSGGHPEIDRDSFEAGEALLAYVESHADITFLISGGGSACVEVPLRPLFDENDVTVANHELLRAGIPIAEMNAARKQRSAIKGGRLGARVRGRSVTLVYSDVSSGDLGSVASGPTIPGRSSDDEAILIADNDTLVNAAAELVVQAGLRPVRLAAQIESDVTSAARELAHRASRLAPGEVLVAGGEPTVAVRGNGRGGRCLDLAVRFVLEAGAASGQPPMEALFGSSDGLDGNSGVAGVFLRLPVPIDREGTEAALAASDSLTAAAELGRPFIISPTGNNLRDLYLVART